MTSWRDLLAKALKKNRVVGPQCRYFQLATVSSDGRPQVRTVVHRGFASANEDALLVISDVRARKIGELANNSAASVAWYFAKTREQFRIDATATVVRHDSADAALLAERQTVWNTLSDAAREQFWWPEPRAPLADEDENVNAVPKPHHDAIPETFALIVLDAHQVDHLVLSKPQQRTIHERTDAEAGWTSANVNP